VVSVGLIDRTPVHPRGIRRCPGGPRLAGDCRP
jgi:hypothetical protein